MSVYRTIGPTLIVHLTGHSSWVCSVSALQAVVYSRPVKINGSPVSLTENAAVFRSVFRKTEFFKKITDFQKNANVLPFFVKSFFL